VFFKALAVVNDGAFEVSVPEDRDILIIAANDALASGVEGIAAGAVPEEKGEDGIIAFRAEGRAEFRLASSTEGKDVNQHIAAVALSRKAPVYKPLIRGYRPLGELRRW
jgi:hypothetical protein